MPWKRAWSTRLEDRVAEGRADLAEAKTQVVSARAAVQEGNANLEAVRSTVTEAEATLHGAEADLRKAQIGVSSTKVFSPWNGIVTKRGYHLGDFVRSGDAPNSAPLLTVSETGKMRVVVEVPDPDSPYLDKGDRAIIKFDALANRNRVYHGVIARTSLAEDIGTRTQRAEIDLNNADGRLRSGQYGRVTIFLQDRRGVLSIPASAVIEPERRAVKPPVIASLTGAPGARRSSLVKKAVIAWRYSKG